MFCCGLLVSGCSKSNGANDKNEFPIRSKFFSSVQIIGSRGTGVGQFNKPRSLALDRDDNLFVVDTTGRVQKFSPDGKFLLSWQMPQTDLGKPKGMGRDSDGNVIVGEPHYMRVNHFTPDGKLVFQWGVKGTNEGQLMFPRSVAVNSQGELFVSEYGLVERVQHFSKDGKTLLGVIGKPGEGAGEFNRAEGIGIDAKDRLYVADSCNHRIQIFSPDGKFLRSFGKAGSGLGELSYPYDVRVDANGFQFVCEFGNSRIQIFDANHQPVEILGEVGAAPGQFANPWSIDFDSHGNLYVADALNHRVQKFVRRIPLQRVDSNPKYSGADESRRDSIIQPGVASSRATLGIADYERTTLKGLQRGGFRPEQNDATPLGLKDLFSRKPRVGAARANLGLNDAIPSGLAEALTVFHYGGDQIGRGFSAEWNSAAR